MPNDSSSTFRVERITTIDATPEQVFSHLDDFHRWLDWSPWEGMDPELQRTYSGADSGLGAVYAWEGNRKVGAGRMEIIDLAAPDSLAIRIDFLKPFKAQNIAHFTLRATGAATNVNWAMVGPKTFMSRLMGLFMSMDKLIGKDFEKGLARLKAAAETEARAA